MSIVIAARNEGHRLTHRIDNLLQLEYGGARQIIVVSDGSTDDTLEVLARYRAPIDIVSVEAGGKAAALNAGVARAQHEIIVFADARQVFAADALVELTAPFRDPRVGAVTGELLLDCESPGRRLVDRRTRSSRLGLAPRPDRRTSADRRRTVESTIADGVGLYWRYEKQIRRCESAVGSTLGATGAIYAMRRSLWVPLPADTILDDVLAPMRAVLAGYRTVFNEKARAFDRVAPDADAEITPEGSDARRELSDSEARAAVAPAVDQSGLVPVCLSQARTLGGALRDAGADRLEHGPRGSVDRLCGGSRSPSACFTCWPDTAPGWTGAADSRPVECPRRLPRRGRPPLRAISRGAFNA